MVDDESQFGGVIWVIFTLLSITGLVYLSIWSYHENNIKGIAIVVIYGFMISISLILTGLEPFKQKGTLTASCFAFAIGFWLYGLIGYMVNTLKAGAFSFLSMGDSNLYATISSELPHFWEVALNVILIPVSEELFWLFGLPITLMYLLDELGEKYDILANPYVQIGIISIIAAITFALFHTAKVFFAFVIGASIYRIVMTVIYWGDEKADIFPGLVVLSTLVLGAHIGHNMFNHGLMASLQVLGTEIFGIIIIIILALIMITAIDFIILKSIEKFKT